MQALLVAVEGPAKGQVWKLPQGVTAFGRDSSNAVAIPDEGVSRHHCELTHDSGFFRLRDLGSRNGTCVNSVEIMESSVKPGETISLGNSSFVIVIDPERTVRSSGVEIGELEGADTATVKLKPGSGGDTGTEVVPSAASEAPRAVGALDAIRRIASAVGQKTSTEESLLLCLDILLKEFSADIAAVVLHEGNTARDLRPMLSLESAQVQGQKAKLTRAVLEEVLLSGQPFFAGDVPTDERFLGARPIVEPGIRGVACVPMSLGGSIRALLYLDSRTSPMDFSRYQRELLNTGAEIMMTALNALDYSQALEKEQVRLKAAVGLEHNIVGRSPQIRQVFSQLSRVVAASSPVLICGESGTGKELVARAIHKNSPRGRGPFVAINCAAIPESLAESELFGHEKGSFTGAHAQKIGPFEEADGGVLFLDEIGDLSLNCQVKLLRVLEQKTVRRVGGNKDLPVDVRVVAATNADLAARVKEGEFREDLYYRLAVIRLDVPPLRERREDIPLLAKYFLGLCAREMPRKVRL